jgi:tRNA pseudouridine38-40 synthase
VPQRNIKLTVSYRGTAYAGWQWQAGQATVQGELSEAVYRVSGERVSLVGAGRTDAGVHALGQVANFRIDHHLEGARWAAALNYYLPRDIRVLESSEVGWEFHATRDAVFRQYRYLAAKERSALYPDLRWEHGREIDFGRLAEAAEMIVGEHDFGAFCVTGSRKEDNRCRVDRSRWYRTGPLLVYEVRGNRFLHSMVRSLVGGMMNLADARQDDNTQNLTLESFADMLRFPDSERCQFTAPPQGLYMVRVGYHHKGTDHEVFHRHR